jgi:hypothetical protein
MSPLDYGTVIVLVIWFVCTIVYQFRSVLSSKLATADVLRVLPRWTFFAPWHDGLCHRLPHHRWRPHR